MIRSQNWPLFITYGHRKTHLSFSTDTLLRYVGDLLAQEGVLEIFRKEISLEIKSHIIFHVLNRKSYWKLNHIIFPVLNIPLDQFKMHTKVLSGVCKLVNWPLPSTGSRKSSINV